MFEFQPNLLEKEKLSVFLNKNIEKTVAFTGHRPEAFKLHNEEDEHIINIKQRLFNLIKEAISQGYCYFVGGGARGTDIWMGEAVLELKKEYPYIKLVTVIPHEAQSQPWSKYWQERYDKLMEKSDMVTVIEPEFSYASYHKRNRFLVDHASLLIAVYNGTKGGTQKTIEYAQKKEKQIIVIDC